MDNKELKNILEENLNILDNLWRLLWHSQEKKRSYWINQSNTTRKFLEWLWRKWSFTKEN